MNYTKIDIEKWSRGKLFRSYIDVTHSVISMSADINVAPLVSFSRENGYNFYPSMLWIISKAVNAHDEFKYSWSSDGELIKWNSISPSYADFYADESFTKFVTEYSDDLSEFHKRFILNREKYKYVRGIVKGQPKNIFDVSCIPWTRYRNLDLHAFDEENFLAPIVTWGDFGEDSNGIRMPLTMNIHHAVCDRVHISRFFNEVQAFIYGFLE